MPSIASKLALRTAEILSLKVFSNVLPDRWLPIDTDTDDLHKVAEESALISMLSLIVSFKGQGCVILT